MSRYPFLMLSCLRLLLSVFFLPEFCIHQPRQLVLVERAYLAFDLLILAFQLSPLLLDEPFFIREALGQRLLDPLKRAPSSF